MSFHIVCWRSWSHLNKVESDWNPRRVETFSRKWLSRACNRNSHERLLWILVLSFGETIETFNGRLTTRLIAWFLIRYVFWKVAVMLIFVIGHKTVLEIRSMRIAPARGMRAQRFRDWKGDGNTGTIGYSMGLCDTSQSFSACKVSFFAVLPDHRRKTSIPKWLPLPKWEYLKKKN